MHCGFGGAYLSRSQVQSGDWPYIVITMVVTVFPALSPSENSPQLFSTAIVYLSKDTNRNVLWLQIT